MLNFLFSPYGRVSRKAFWLYFMLPSFAVSIASVLLDVAFFAVPPGDVHPAPVFRIILGVPLSLSSIVLLIKRLHDRGVSGWWMAPPLSVHWHFCSCGPVFSCRRPLALFIPGAAAVLYIMIQTYFLRGQAGPNRFGPDPLADQAETFG
jgi:uncharacterized membrane protein YhaH (DUF805 family)